jgi:RNA polymerase sigma-32 factor
MLRPEDEYTLAHQWIATKDKCAQDQIIGSHLRLVSKIAQGYRGYGMPILDLISEGHMGLLKALENFDPDRGARFSTYALLWIKAHMKDYVIRNWSLVKTGTTAAQKKLFFKLRAKTHAVLDEGQRFLDDEQIVQISKDLNVPEKTVVEMTTRLAGSDYSLNTPISVGEDSDGEWQDWLEDETDSHDMKIAEQDELKKRMMVLKNALHVLKPRELQILQRRRLQEPPHTLEEIGLALNLSRERVRQLEVSAFLKIQKSVRTHVQEKFQGM